jgi:hypothetical protein
MDIIIKTQTGSIVKADILTPIISNTYDTDGRWGIAYKVDENGCGIFFAGRYPTEERAREVMAEIEEYIRKKYTSEQFNSLYTMEIRNVAKLEPDDMELAIFDMPAE